MHGYSSLSAPEPREENPFLNDMAHVTAHPQVAPSELRDRILSDAFGDFTRTISGLAKRENNEVVRSKKDVEDFLIHMIDGYKNEVTQAFDMFMDKDKLINIPTASPPSPSLDLEDQKMTFDEFVKHLKKLPKAGALKVLGLADPEEVVKAWGLTRLPGSSTTADGQTQVALFNNPEGVGMDTDALMEGFRLEEPDLVPQVSQLPI